MQRGGHLNDQAYDRLEQVVETAKVPRADGVGKAVKESSGESDSAVRTLHLAEARCFQPPAKRLPRRMSQAAGLRTDDEGARLFKLREGY